MSVSRGTVVKCQKPFAVHAQMLISVLYKRFKHFQALACHPTKSDLWQATDMTCYPIKREREKETVRQ